MLAAGLVIIQFFQPEKNYQEITSDDLFSQIEVPENVGNLIKNSCYDCHSNQTNYPWYNRVAPVSWMIADHIKVGKDNLNFSTWGQLSKRKQIGALSEICEVCENHEMPLNSYLIIHKDAALSAEDIQQICDWTETSVSAVMKR